MILNTLKKNLKSYADPAKAKTISKFFKAGWGEYAEGDKFSGVSVPNCRIIAKKYSNLPLSEIQKLIRSEIHEERLVALLILVEQFEKADRKEQERIFNFYLKNTKHINNWDLVDLSSYKIVGRYLFQNPYCTTIFKGQAFKDTKLLNHLAKSTYLWERRIAVVATFAFIKNGELEKTLEISEILLNDKHDLIHKAAGWMLREVGKISQKREEDFLKKHYKNMPRTMLRYAIERFGEEKRQLYLKSRV